jgi:hypothetical protein
MSIEGSDVHDATHDVVLLHYSAIDSDIEAAIIALTSQRTGSSSTDSSLDVSEPNVRAWRMYAHGNESAFLRPKNDHILAIVPLDKAKEWAHTLAGTVVKPAPHGAHAVDIRASKPSNIVPLMPAAFTDERIFITARGDGAVLQLEGDCPDEASAGEAAQELERAVRKRNTLAVKLVTGGAFTAFHAAPKGSMVVGEMPVSADQLDALLKMVALAEGASLPRGAP